MRFPFARWVGWTLTLFLAILSQGAAPAQAAELWVDQAAAAGGDGSAARPFRTINEVKARLGTGDTVLIKGGTYRETVDFWHVPAGSGGRTTIRAAAGETVIIDGGNADFVLQAGETPNMTFQDLTIRNGATGINFYQADGGEVIGCVTQATGGSVSFYFASHGYVAGCTLAGSVSGKASDGTVLENNEIYGSDAEGITLHADSKNCRYSHNVVHDNTSVNIYLDSISNTVVDGNLVYMTLPTDKETVGIMLADEEYPTVKAPVLDHITITNNIVLNNESGIRFWDGEFAGTSALRNVLIANNTVLNNLTTAIKWDAGPHQNTRVVNNIFAGRSGSQMLLLQANSTAGVALDHNLWFLPGVDEPFLWGSSTYDHAGWVTTASQGTADVLVEPQLAGSWGLPATNLKLGPGSPAIDKGASLAEVTTDFDGAPRPTGAAIDIGAYEFGAVAPDGGAVAVRPDSGAPPAQANRDGSPAGSDAGNGSGCGCRVDGQGSARSGDWGMGLALLAAVILGRRLRSFRDCSRRARWPMAGT
jgi:MYXO-CTERM domain-containing protein